SLETNAINSITDPMDRSYQLIARNRIPEAILMADKNPDIEPVVYRLIAASVNAPEEVVNKVLSYQPSDGINYHTAWIALGSSIKYNHQYNEYLQQLDE